MSSTKCSLSSLHITKSSLVRTALEMPPLTLSASIKYHPSSSGSSTKTSSLEHLRGQTNSATLYSRTSYHSKQWTTNRVCSAPWCTSKNQSKDFKMETPLHLIKDRIRSYKTIPRRLRRQLRHLMFKTVPWPFKRLKTPIYMKAIQMKALRGFFRLKKIWQRSERQGSGI